MAAPPVVVYVEEVFVRAIHVAFPGKDLLHPVTHPHSIYDILCPVGKFKVAFLMGLFYTLLHGLCVLVMPQR